MPHDHFVPQCRQQPAHPGRMRPRLHRDATPWHASEYLLYGFWCGRQFMLQNDFSCSIQDAVGTGAISEIQANGELPLENVFPTCPHSANLLHCRSPFYCASSTSNIGSVSHPAGDRPYSSHLILDEPSEGLDPVSIEELLQEIVKAVAAGVTVFFSSHQIVEVERIADRVCIIDHGRLLVDAS